jgi:hypothetical protein
MISDEDSDSESDWGGNADVEDARDETDSFDTELRNGKAAADGNNTPTL